MRLVIKRCKHCGQEYSYQMSGEGCHDKYNNKDYCPTCYEVMMTALEKVPIKYHPQYVEVKQNETIINDLHKLKEDYEKEIYSDTFRCQAIKCVMHHGDEYVYKGKNYLYEDGKLYLLSECNANNETTGKPWREYGDTNNYYIPTNGYRPPSDDEIKEMKECQMPPPLGKLLFNDLGPQDISLESIAGGYKCLLNSVKPYRH